MMVETVVTVVVVLLILNGAQFVHALTQMQAGVEQLANLLQQQLLTQVVMHKHLTALSKLEKKLIKMIVANVSVNQVFFCIGLTYVETCIVGVLTLRLGQISKSDKTENLDLVIFQK